MVSFLVSINFFGVLISLTTGNLGDEIVRRHGRGFRNKGDPGLLLMGNQQTK